MKGNYWLVASTRLKNMLVKLDHLPRDRGENNKYLSCHHLENYGSTKVQQHF